METAENRNRIFRYGVWEDKSREGPTYVSFLSTENMRERDVRTVIAILRAEKITAEHQVVNKRIRLVGDGARTLQRMREDLIAAGGWNYDPPGQVSSCVCRSGLNDEHLRALEHAMRGAGFNPSVETETFGPVLRVSGGETLLLEEKIRQIEERRRTEQPLPTVSQPNVFFPEPMHRFS